MYKYVIALLVGLFLVPSSYGQVSYGNPKLSATIANGPAYGYSIYSDGINNLWMLSTNGPMGPQGIPGQAATFVVNSTSNGAPGSQAIVTNIGTTTDAQLNFVIPVGATGATGAKGDTGTAGVAATIGVAWSSNSAYGTTAYVANVGSSSAASLGFIIPGGAPGAQGAQGNPGTPGAAATIGVAWASNGVPGSAVIVTNVGSSSAASFGFRIPAGSNGAAGATGATGPTGTAATVSVAWTSNGVAGSSAVVTNVGNSNNASFGFIIPRGADGAGNGLYRYTVANKVQVLASDTNITATITTNGASSLVALTIPTNTRLVSMRIVWDGNISTSFNVDIGTGDMSNSSATDRWGPSPYFWRTDTGARVLGNVTLNTSTYTEFTIASLASGVENICVLGF